SGSYTLSHGLESLIQQDKIGQPEDVANFLRILLHQKIAPCDLVALLHAHRAARMAEIAQIRHIAELLQAQTANQTTRKTQIQSGRALLMVAQSTWQNPLLETLARDRALNQFHCLHPVVFGVVAQVAGLNPTDTALGFLHGFVTGVLGAAIRLSSLGHLQAQTILVQLAPDLETAYQTASTVDLDEMWTCAPAIDIAQMRHSKLNSKLFAS
ncbi:MAG: urease accessory UreF family protein, partial [Cyanobacteria bacterium J06600_6]